MGLAPDTYTVGADQRIHRHLYVVHGTICSAKLRQANTFATHLELIHDLADAGFEEGAFDSFPKSAIGGATNNDI